MPDDGWHDLGPVETLRDPPLRMVRIGRTRIALSYRDGVFGAVSGVCNHAGGPLGEGTLDGDYIVCPWHYWKFHRATGEGEPGYEEDAVPRHDVKVENGRVLVNGQPASPRTRKPHAPHPLARAVQRAPGRVTTLLCRTEQGRRRARVPDRGRPLANPPYKPRASVRPAQGRRPFRQTAPTHSGRRAVICQMSHRPVPRLGGALRRCELPPVQSERRRRHRTEAESSRAARKLSSEAEQSS